MGLIFSDGCLSYDKHTSRYRITIAMKDRTHIEKSRQIIAPSKKLYKQKTQAGTYSYSVITRNEFDISFLKKLGLEERKSNVLRFPQLPIEYMSDFVRGYFDGDGCVYVSNQIKGVKYLAISFTCGSKNFLDGLELWLKSNNIHCTRNEDTR